MSLLNLKNNTGSLGKNWLDLPPVARISPETHYFRRRETHLLPPSYRSGLVLFAAIMIVTVLGLTGIHAKTMAESQQSWISAQLIEDFFRLRKSLEPSGSTPETQPPEQGSFVIQAPETLPTLIKRDDPESNLQHLRVALSDGDEDFRHLTQIWENTEDIPLIDQLDRMKPVAEQALESWNEVLSQTDNIPLENVNDADLASFRDSRASLERTTAFLSAFNQGYSPLRSLLGADSPQRLLVFLQDPSERRATGGAIDGGLEILINEGKIITWKPFISGADGMATANSFLDFPQSAEKLHWFWQREAHSSADAIIVINTTALGEILNAQDLGADWSQLRLAGKREELKTLASSSIEHILSLLKNPNSMLSAWPTIQDLVQQKQIMVYSTDPDLQSELKDFHLSAALPSLAEHEDVLMIAGINNDHNISDRSIEEAVRLDTAIRADGSINHWLKISRHNRGSAGNRSQMRILVPLGSRVTSADGIHMTDISSMDTDSFTVWSFDMSLFPGESKSLALSYTLPWSFDTTSVDNYRLTLLKQPGTNPIAFEHHLKLPAELTIFQQLPEEEISVWDRDLNIAVVAGKNP